MRRRACVPCRTCWRAKFLGCAANALDQRLEKERAELKLLEGEMQLLYVGLMRYADALEEADRQAAEALAGQ